MHRLILGVCMLISLVAAAQHPVHSQDAAPVEAGLLTTLGLPELRVVVTDAGVIAPESVPAGRVLLTVEAANSQGVADISLVRLPDGLGEDAAEAMLAGFTGEGAPDFLFEWTFAGGVEIASGTTQRVAIELTPGRWYLAGGGRAEGEDLPAATPGASDKLRPITVTEVSAQTRMAPAGTVRVEAQEFAFAIPDRLAAGPQIWEIRNLGLQPHLVSLFRAPFAIATEQVAALLALEEGGTPAPEVGITVEQMDQIDIAAGYVHFFSGGLTVWAELDLKPGHYIALCFMPDRASGMAHADMGMIDVFVVDDGDATPSV